jgi:peptide/nickel transport system substrate-binding protein
VKLTKFAIVPEGSPDEIERPVGTGAYRFLERSPDGTIKLQWFDDHWEGSRSFTYACFHSIPNARARLTALLEGELDLINALPASQAQDLEDHPEVTAVSAPGLGVTYLQLRPDRPPFDDRRVREAVDLALDRQALVETILGGHGLPLGQMASPYVFGYVPDMGPRERDLERSRELLQAAGKTSQIPVVLEHREHLLATPIRDQLREAGLLVETMPRPWDEMYERLNRGDPTFYAGTWITTLGDVSELLENKAHSVDPERGLGDSNTNGYRNPVLDSLIEESSETLSADRRQIILGRAMKLLMDDRVLLPLFMQNELYGVRRTIHYTPRIDTRIVVEEITRAD